MAVSISDTLQRARFRNGAAPEKGRVSDVCLASGERWKRVRQWSRIGDSKAKLLPWINLNPAGNAIDERGDWQILKKPGAGWNMVSISWRWGFDGCVAYNVFPIQDPDPRNIKAWLDNSAQPLIEESNARVAEDLRLVDAAIVAWGGNKLARRFAPALVSAIQASRRIASHQLELWCVKLNKDGSPKHPSRISHDVVPIRYSLG